MAQNIWGRVGTQRTETEILQQEIHELRQRMLSSNTPIDPEQLPPSTIGAQFGTLGSKLKSLIDFRKTL
jgi:hypothetical protein